MKLKSVVRQHNKVQGYYIETEKGVKFISKEQLKQTMKLKGLLVDGLKLTRDGRLLESKKSRNPKDLKSPQNSKEQPKVPTEKQYKNKLRFQLELRDKLGIAEPMIVEGIRYFIEDNKVCCECVDKNITKANILDGTEIIEGSAFAGCTSLTSVTLPSSLNTIRRSAFERCTSLTSVHIPNSVTKIGYCAFESCTGLTSITIPNSLTKIGSCTFYDCTNLKYVYCYKGSEADDPRAYPARVTFKYL